MDVTHGYPKYLSSATSTQGTRRTSMVTRQHATPRLPTSRQAHKAGRLIYRHSAFTFEVNVAFQEAVIYEIAAGVAVLKHVVDEACHNYHLAFLKLQSCYNSRCRLLCCIHFVSM